MQNGAIIVEQYRWIESLGLELSFRLDGLSLLFGLIISGVGAAVALYTHYYLEDDERQGYFYLSLFAFMASMLGLVWADNLLTLFVFWEGTSVTSYRPHRLLTPVRRRQRRRPQRLRRYSRWRPRLNRRHDPVRSAERDLHHQRDRLPAWPDGTRPLSGNIGTDSSWRFH